MRLESKTLCSTEKHSCEGYALEKYGKEAGIPAIAPSLPAWTERMFQKMDAILFIGACGIAVRSIAPYVKSKRQIRRFCVWMNRESL